MAQDIEDRLVQTIQKQLDKVNYYCSAEYILPDLVVHEIRKSFKRIRAILKFYPESHGEIIKVYSKQIKSLAKQLTPARESSVNIQLWDKLGTGNRFFSKQRDKEIRDFLVEENKIFIKNIYADNKILFEIRSFKFDIEAKLFGILFHPSVKIDVRQRLSISYKKGYNLLQRIGTDYDAELYHNLRKIMKALLYQFDFAKVDQPKFFKLKANALKKITDQLGDDHDWYIFQDEMRKATYKLESAEIEILDKQIRLFWDPNINKVLPRLQEFFKEPPESFENKIRSIYTPDV